MQLTQQIAKNFREIHFGGNWTCSNLKEVTADITWQQAITKIQDFNTIATLVFHTHYFVEVALKVLQGGPLVGNDKLSFDHPPINSQADWEAMLNQYWLDAEAYATLVESMPEEQCWEVFTDSKYGNYYRNLHGIIEHTHYHLGQIVLLKKLVRRTSHI